MTGINLEKLAQQFEFDKLNDFLAEVGRGEIGPRQLQTALRTEEAAPDAADEQPLVRKPRAQPDGILVVGVSRALPIVRSQE